MKGKYTLNRYPNGITLVEVLITSALCVVLVAILYSTLDIASQVSARGEAIGFQDALVRALKSRLEQDVQEASVLPRSIGLPNALLAQSGSLTTNKDFFPQIPSVFGCGDLILVKTSQNEQVALQKHYGLGSRSSYYAYFVFSDQSVRPVSRRLRDLGIIAGSKLESIQHTEGLHRYLLCLQEETMVADLVFEDSDYQCADYASLYMEFFDGVAWGDDGSGRLGKINAFSCSVTLRSGVGDTSSRLGIEDKGPSKQGATYAFTIATRL